MVNGVSVGSTPTYAAMGKFLPKIHRRKAMCKKCQHKYLVRVYTFNGPRVKYFQGDEAAFEKAVAFFELQKTRAEISQVLVGPKGPYERKLMSHR
jgi:hypothetical protein